MFKRDFEHFTILVFLHSRGRLLPTADKTCDVGFDADGLLSDILIFVGLQVFREHMFQLLNRL